VRGSGGIFDVIADGSLVYSKHRTGEFPSERAIIDELRSRHR
jgi:predicted Rdx family selenoprotein